MLMKMRCIATLTLRRYLVPLGVLIELFSIEISVSLPFRMHISQRYLFMKEGEGP